MARTVCSIIAGRRLYERRVRAHERQPLIGACIRSTADYSTNGLVFQLAQSDWGNASRKAVRGAGNEATPQSEMSEIQTDIGGHIDGRQTVFIILETMITLSEMTYKTIWYNL